jgi:rhodanese-related sulfurtransferase
MDEAMKSTSFATLSTIGRSIVLTAACVIAGVVFNTARSGGIPLVAPRPYEIYVPCPETTVEAAQVTTQELAGAEDVLYVDARPEAEFEREHIAGAVSLPYPVLDDPPPDKVASLKRRKRRIVTYGGGGRGDLGKMMASVLTELGVENVNHLEGGLQAWKARGGRTETQPPEGGP